MFRVIKASKSFKDLQIRTFRFHPEYAPTTLKTCDESKGMKVRKVFNENKNDILKSICKVNIADLVTDQDQNDIDVLRKLYEMAPSIEQLQNISEDFPVVVQYQGTLYLLDGNTRTILIQHLGGTSIKCQFYNLDKI